MATSTASTPLPAYARVLRALIARHGLTQTKLAAKSGLNASLISQHCNGHVEPTSYTIQRYALALGMDPSVLVDRIESAKHPNAGRKGRPRLVLYLGDQIVGESSDPVLFADVIERVERVPGGAAAG